MKKTSTYTHTLRYCCRAFALAVMVVLAAGHLQAGTCTTGGLTGLIAPETGSAAAGTATCNTTPAVTLCTCGSGAYVSRTLTNNTYYDFTLSGGQNNTAYINGTTGNPITNYLASGSAINVGSSRSSVITCGNWTGASATLTYKYSNPSLSITSGQGAGGAAASVCIGTSSTYGVTSTATNVYSWTSSNTGVATVSSNTSSTPTVNFVGVGTCVITCAYSNNGNCGSSTATGTITVKPNETIAISSGSASPTTCINVAPTAAVFATNSTVTGASITAGSIPAGMTAVYGGGTGGNFTISGTPTASGSFSYTITTSGSCNTAQAAGTITVTANQSIGISTGSASPTTCINVAPTAAVFATNSSVTGASITGGSIPAGMTGVYSGGTGGTFTISGTPSAAGSFPYTVTTTGSCGAATATGTITVTPNNTIAISSGSASPTTCINVAPTAAVFATNSTVTGASITGGALPAGMTGVYSGGTGGTFTISGTPTASGSFSYTITTSGSCVAATATGTITVNPNNTIAISSGSATISTCVNVAPTAAVFATNSTVTGASVTATLPAGMTGVYSGGTGGTFTISGTPTASGSFSYTITTSGSCVAATTTGTITVGSNQAISISTGSANPSSCINVAPTAAVFATNSNVTGATVTATLPAGMSGTYSGGTGGTFTISGTPTASGSFPYTITTSGSCAVATATGTITVTPNQTIAISTGSASPATCINVAPTSAVFATNSSVTGATITAGTLPTGMTGSYGGGTGSNFTISGTPTVAGTFPYTITTSGSCVAASVAGTITVTANQTIALSTGSASPATCINVAPTAAVFTTNSSVTGASITGGALPAGMTGVYSGGTGGSFTISGTPTASGTFPYTITTSGSCTAATATGTITVYAVQALSVTGGVASPTLCKNTALGTNTVYTFGGSASSASITAGALPAGMSGIVSGSTFIISGSPTASGSFPYTITTSGTGSCSPVSLGGTITVNNTQGMTLTGGSASPAAFCQNTALATSTVFTFTGGATSASITAGALPAGMTGVVSGSTFVISGTPTVSGTFPYTVTSSGAGSCSPVSIGGTITVNPIQVITLTSGSTTPANFCQNTAMPTNIVFTLSGGATGANVVGLPSGMNGVLSGSTFTISGTPTVSGSFPYTVTTSGTCATATTGGTINVDPIQSITLSSGSPSTTVCINVALSTNIVYTIGGGATGATTTGLPAGITGSLSGSTYTISGTPTVSGSFPFTVTTSGTCAIATTTGTITVNDNQVITLTSGSSTPASFCQNTALPVNIVYTLSGGATGIFSISGLPTGITGSLSGLTYTISGTPTVSGTYNYTINTSGTCIGASATGTIIVDPVQAITLTSGSSSPSAFCINTALSTNIVYTLSGGATGATTTGLPSGISDVLVGNTLTISGTPTVSGTFPFTVTTSGTCAVAYAGGTITVQPDQSITLTSGSATPSAFCQNTAIPANIVYALNASVASASTTGLPTGMTGVKSGSTYTISGTPTVSGSFPYTITTSGYCISTYTTGTITVDPTQTITLTSGTNTPAAFCINTSLGTSIGYTLAGGATGATVTGLPAGMGGSQIGSFYTLSGTPTVSGTFNYTVTTSGPGTCPGATAFGTVVVTPDQTITLTSGSATPAAFCQNTALGTNIVYTVNASATGASTVGLPSGMSGSLSGSTYTISGTPTVSGSFPYTVTTSGSCVAATTTGTITVSPVQAITLTSGSTSPSAFCQYTALPTNIVFTLSGGATSASAAGLPSGMSGSLSGSTYTISGTPTVSGSFPYTVTTSGTCATANTGGTITVYAAPVATITPPASFCTDPSGTTGITYTTQSGQSSYTWTVSGTLGTDYTIVAGGTSSDNYITIAWISTGSQTVTVNYANANGCFALTPGSNTHTINASPSAANLADVVDPCNGGHTATVTITGGTPNYNFTVCGTSYTNQASPFAISSGTNTSCSLTLVTDANGCAPGTITGSPVSYPTTFGLSAGDSVGCTVGSGATRIFYDHSGDLMAKITDQGSGLGTTTVKEYVDGSVQKFGPTSPQSYLQRHYDITPGTAGSANVCLYLTDAEASALYTSSLTDNHGAPAFYNTFSATLANVAITKFHGSDPTNTTNAPETPQNNQSRLVIPTGSITVSHNPSENGNTYSNVYRLCFTVSTWSGFYIHSNNNSNTPLPVTLLYLTADAVDNKYIHLEWATASEINNKGFEVERSTDGVDFKSIAWVDGSGNTNSKITYQTDDKTAQSGVTYYYRLKQIDIDANYAYSEIVSASLTGDKGFVFADMIPNPASNSVQLGILSNFGQKTTVTISDMLGRTVISDQWQLAEGYNINTLDLRAVAAGTYNVTVYSGSIYVTKKLVITR